MDLLNSQTYLSGIAPWSVSEFSVESTPLLIRAFGLGPDDLICVQAVRRRQPTSGDFTLANCGVTAPDGTVITAREYLKDCGIKVCICRAQPWTIVYLPGDYALEVSGTNIAAHTVVVEGVAYHGELPNIYSRCSACAPG